MYILGYSGFTRNSRSLDGYRNPFAKTGQDFDSIFTFQDGEVPFQMYPLGFFGHDAAASIIKNGKIIASAAEERFIRSKYSLNLAGNTLLPKHSIQYCLQTAGITINEVELVTHYCSFDEHTVQKRLDLIKPFVSENEATLLSESYNKTYNDMMDRNVQLNQFKQMIGHVPRNFAQVNHHNAHAASSFYVSGFNKAIIFTLDGTGELESSLLAVGIDNKIKEIRRTYLPTSLGTLYLIITVFLGFKSLGDEYKVMGLAGYGKPDNYRKFFRSLIQLENNGSYIMSDFVKGDLKQRILDGLGPPRRRNESIKKRHCDIAAALQESLQETVLHSLTHARKEIGLPNLCLAGGVALNSMLNGAIARSGLFENIFIQPAASDEGCGLGSALYAYNHNVKKNNSVGKRLENVYLGPSYDKEEIIKVLEQFDSKISWEHNQNLTKVVAKEIANGKVVGWFQGKMEFGPRALGNRSILADPRIPEMKNKINEKVKHRENFRPFAPAVAEENADDYFDMTGIGKSPFMLFVVPVKNDQIHKIPAVTHIDKTARIQTVSKRSNRKFWDLINEFKNITGIAVILNTSFNVMNEPIVCTPSDAVRCFLSTDIDLLAIGDYLIKKRD